MQVIYLAAEIMLDVNNKPILQQVKIVTNTEAYEEALEYRKLTQELRMMNDRSLLKIKNCSYL